MTYNGACGTRGSAITCNIATNVFIKSPMHAAGAPAAAPTAGSQRAASAFNCAFPSRGCARPSSANAASHSIRMILRSGRTMRMPALKSNVSTATRLSSAEPLQISQEREQEARVALCQNGSLLHLLGKAAAAVATDATIRRGAAPAGGDVAKSSGSSGLQRVSAQYHIAVVLARYCGEAAQQQQLPDLQRTRVTRRQLHGEGEGEWEGCTSCARAGAAAIRAASCRQGSGVNTSAIPRPS